jgi:hypothetical protein
MKEPNMHLIDIVEDVHLRRKETIAKKILKRFFPDAELLRLYRTNEGHIGIQLDLDVSLVNHGQMDRACDEIIKILSKKRGQA